MIAEVILQVDLVCAWYWTVVLSAHIHFHEHAKHVQRLVSHDDGEGTENEGSN